MKTIQEALEAMEAEWNKTKTTYKEARDGIAVPSGIYTLVLNKATLKLSKEKGNPYISRTWTVLSGSFSGSKIFDNMSLTEKGISYARIFIEDCNYEQPELEDLQDTLDAISKDNLAFSAEVKIKGDFTNVYIRGTAEEADEPEPEPEPEPDSDSDSGSNSDFESLFLFLTSRGVKVKETMDLAKLISTGDKHSFEESSLTEEERDLLTRVGLEETIAKRSLPLKKAIEEKQPPLKGKRPEPRKR